MHRTKRCCKALGALRRWRVSSIDAWLRGYVCLTRRRRQVRRDCSRAGHITACRAEDSASDRLLTDAPLLEHHSGSACPPYGPALIVNPPHRRLARPLPRAWPEPHWRCSGQRGQVLCVWQLRADGTRHMAFGPRFSSRRRHLRLGRRRVDWDCHKPHLAGEETLAAGQVAGRRCSRALQEQFGLCCPGSAARGSFWTLPWVECLSSGCSRDHSPLHCMSN